MDFCADEYFKLNFKNFYFIEILKNSEICQHPKIGSLMREESGNSSSITTKHRSSAEADHLYHFASQVNHLVSIFQVAMSATCASRQMLGKAYIFKKFFIGINL